MSIVGDSGSWTNRAGIEREHLCDGGQPNDDILKDMVRKMLNNMRFRDVGVVPGMRKKLSGDILMMLPISWHLIGGVMIAMVGVALTFLFKGDYAQVVTVRGVAMSVGGAPPVTAPGKGHIARVLVSDGQRVSVGEALANIDIDRLTDEPGLGQARQLGEQGLNAMRLAEPVGAHQTAVVFGAADHDQVEQFNLERDGDMHELRALDVSQLSRRPQLTDMRREVRPAEGAGCQSQRFAAGGRTGFAGRKDRNVAVCLISRAGRTKMSSSFNQQLTAPIEGTVQGLVAYPGQEVEQGQILLTVVPLQSRLVAELQIPESDYGSIRVGQKVRISLDAFPAARFGTLEGRILSLSGTPVQRQDLGGKPATVFLAAADMSRSYVVAYGERRQLAPGMRMTASIVGERQSLFHWLFDPIFAVRGS